VSGPRKRIQTRHTDGGEIVICERTFGEGGLHYEVIVNGAFLFSTYNRDSERELARMAIGPLLFHSTDLSVLIAGLGAGFTLEAALEYREVRHVTVVEKEALVLEWARTYFSPYNGNALADNRVEVATEDFLTFIGGFRNTFDALCVDIDNGPHWTVWEANKAVYRCPGLKQIKRLLRPGGYITIWSSKVSEELRTNLSDAFGNVTVHPVESVELGMKHEYSIYRSCA
jgi:spermidine synthase